MTQLTLHQADGAHGAHGTCVGGAQASPLHANNLSGAASVCAATGDYRMALKAPFPYFGGKSKIAPLIWSRFGDVDNYVEPFAGSLAALLARPDEHSAKAETVNDLDRYIANFWRAVQDDPAQVAHYADWPVNEVDLTARHLWLVNEGRERLERMNADPGFYDAKIAGWWLWGICSWIGSGWCSGTGPWMRGDDGKLCKRENVGRGVNRQRPHLGNAGQGINRQLSHLGSFGPNKIHRGGDVEAYMHALATRLHRVRVCCGDWTRVVTTGALAYGATVGILLDPPYAADTRRDMTLYNHETEVSATVREWAIANGDNPRYRIALCGYEGEHTMPDSWRVVAWKASAAYKTHNGDKNGNRHRERIWFSPHCLDTTQSLMSEITI